jgi:hypothetical protein
MLNPKNPDCILLYKGTLSTFKIRVVIPRKKSGPKKNIFHHEREPLQKPKLPLKLYNTEPSRRIHGLVSHLF